MNHSLKFRVWHKEFKKFLPHEEWVIGLNGDLYFYGIKGGRTDLFTVDKDLYVIQQYTGLLDKNGKEIFECDIIKYNGIGNISNFWESRIGKVIYSNNYSGKNTAEFIIMVIKGRGVSDSFFTIKDFETIGNICENPDLIK